MNNLQLLDYAKKSLSENWGYVWGTFGQVLTPELLTQKMKQYPVGVGSYVDFIRANWVGRHTADCVGLIKGAYWNETGRFIYRTTTDVSADGMFDKAAEKGFIHTIPELPGICVWKKGHIGIYIGNGQVIEARGTKVGVIQSNIGDLDWTHWLKCPFIEYIEDRGKYYVVTNYLPATKYGVEIVGIIDKYFQGAQRLYMDHNDKGQWIVTQYFDKKTAEIVANRLKVDNLFYEMKVD